MSLTASMSVKLGPILFGTLVRHYLDRQFVTKESKARDELVYDEMFIIVKTFMETATKHTVEELQAFSNTKIPPPPWVRTIQVRVPLSSCDAAADKLIEALGGPEVARKVVGGTRWWQIRSIHGIHGEWIMVKKSVDEERRRRKHDLRHAKSQTAMNGARDPGPAEPSPEPHIYTSEMDGTRCMLYIHGGGYYFGSIDQQRYCLHRYARKMNGRVFAINYRLAPQYPFPCAIQDALAAYLYLINPPPGASHAPVDPSLIICAGDSAGGGTVLALLQVIRDSGLPAPAGAVLISPWCDLTHSFPSLHTNGATDIIPPYGLSVHKPSPLWPPPTLDATIKFRNTFTKKVKNAVMRRLESLSESQDHDSASPTTSKHHKEASTTTVLGDKVKEHEAPSPSLHNFAVPSDVVRMLVDGKEVEIKSQFQFYAMNSQLAHPLVSPALGYLGGLPPCLFIVSDKEVLRDEIIYTAHKAANPEKYGVNEESRKLYPALNGIEQRYGPTNVHLQAYDETCHVLPLYSFCTPAKYCYRAIATFCKLVTGGLAPSPTPNNEKSQMLSSTLVSSPVVENGEQPPTADDTQQIVVQPTSLARKLTNRLSFNPRNSAIFNFGTVPPNENADVAGPRFKHRGDTEELPDGPDTAGNPVIYETNPLPFKDNMIRERVSTQGILRPMEPEDQLAGCSMEPEKIGILSEVSVKRYLKGQAAWEKKFHNISKSIEKARKKNVELAEKKDLMRLQKLKAVVGGAARRRGNSVGAQPAAADGDAAKPSSSELSRVSSMDGDATDPVACAQAKNVLGSRQWDWGWALDGEMPPPSSIVSRRDTDEARQLGRIADKQFGPGDSEHYLSGNNLWQVIVELLTVTDSANGKMLSLPLGGGDDKPETNTTTKVDVKGKSKADGEHPTRKDRDNDQTLTVRASRFFGISKSPASDGGSGFLAPEPTVRPRKLQRQGSPKSQSSNRSSIFFGEFFSRFNEDSKSTSIAEHPEEAHKANGGRVDATGEAGTSNAVAKMPVPTVVVHRASAEHSTSPEPLETKRFSLFRSRSAR